MAAFGNFGGFASFPALGGFTPGGVDLTQIGSLLQQIMTMLGINPGYGQTPGPGGYYTGTPPIQNPIRNPFSPFNPAPGGPNAGVPYGHPPTQHPIQHNPITYPVGPEVNPKLGFPTEGGHTGGGPMFNPRLGFDNPMNNQNPMAYWGYPQIDPRLYYRLSQARTYGGPGWGNAPAWGGYGNYMNDSFPVRAFS